MNNNSTPQLRTRSTERHIAHDPGAPLLRVNQLTVQYDEVKALEEVSFELQQSDRLAVVGPNGAGKSTLFKAIAGLLKPTSGSVQIAGHEPNGHLCIAYIPQRSLVDWNFPVTVSNVVMMGRTGRLGLLHWPGKEDRKIVQRALAVVNLEVLANRQISQLSGGQQQRMFIARALAQEAELILMDEPLTGLDVPARDELFAVFDLLHAQGVTIMVALHDLELAGARFDRILLLNRRLFALGSAREVFKPEILSAAYGSHLRLMNNQQGTIALEDTCCDEGEHDHV